LDKALNNFIRVLTLRERIGKGSKKGKRGIENQDEQLAAVPGNL